MDIVGYSFASLRAFMDQDEMRQREGNELLESYHSAVQVAGKRWKIAQAIVFCGLFTIPVTLFLLPDYSNLINGSVIVMALTYMVLASLAIFRPHRRLKAFLDEEEDYLLRTWGSRTHPTVRFAYLDDTHEIAEVTVERDGEIFEVGLIENLSSSEFAWVTKSQF